MTELARQKEIDKRYNPDISDGLISLLINKKEWSLGKIKDELKELMSIKKPTKKQKEKLISLKEELEKIEILHSKE